MLGGMAATPEGLERAGRIAAATGCALMTEFYMPRLARGAGRVVAQRLPYAVEPALATGGSGDALSGVLGGLAAQFVRADARRALPLFETACLAVQLHADSATRWAAKHGHAGMLAEEIADGIPDAMAALRA